MKKNEIEIEKCGSLKTMRIGTSSNNNRRLNQIIDTKEFEQSRLKQKRKNKFVNES